MLHSSVQMKARMLRVTRTHLAKEANIGYNTLDGWQNEDWRPTTATLEKVEKALERLER